MSRGLELLAGALFVFAGFVQKVEGRPVVGWILVIGGCIIILGNLILLGYNRGRKQQAKPQKPRIRLSIDREIIDPVIREAYERILESREKEK